MKAIAYILSTIVALLVAQRYVPGVIIDKNIFVLAFAGIIIGFGNFFVKPILKAASFPLMMATFGLFNLALSAFILWLATQIVSGFTITGFTALLMTTLLIGVANILASIIIRH